MEKQPVDYVATLLYLITTPDAFSREEHDNIVLDAVEVVRQARNFDEASEHLAQTILLYVEERRDEVEEIRRRAGVPVEPSRRGTLRGR